MTWPDYLAGQRLFVDGEEQSPRRNAWNLLGASATFNESTGMWDITVSAGGVGLGDVVGPASSIDDRLTLFNSTSGKLIKQSAFGIADIIKRNGSTAFTSDQSLGGFKLVNLGTPSDPTDAATKAYVDAASAGAVDWKASARAATTANITLSGAQTIDGVSVIAGDRVLVKDQSTGSQNGIYVAAAGAWSRATDADVSAEVTAGLGLVVEEGTANGGKVFLLTTVNPITLGSTSLTFTQLSGGAGTPDAVSITLNGSSQLQRAALTGDVTASVGSNATTIANNAVTTVKIADANVTLAKMANMATDSLIGRDTAASGVPEVISLNATLSMTGTGSLQRAALTGDVTAAAGSNTTAIAADVIVDADINSAAAIAHSKLANLAARSVLGRSVNTSGAMAAITGGGSGTVLYDNGATISFQPIQISAISNVATDRLLGRDTAGTGVVEEINLDATLAWSGAGSIGRAGITGDITIAAGSNTSAITAGAIVNADVNAAAAIAGTKISPNFGAQDIITTGSLLLGASPASSGAVRLTNNEYINFKSQAGTTVTGIGMSSTDRIAIGSSSSSILAMDFGIGSSGAFGFNVGGTAVLDIDANSVDMGAGVVALRFLSQSSAVSVGPIANNTDDVTGIGTTFLGQDVTGAGATVGGVTRLRGANSTSGTGGVLSLRSGAGATAIQAGAFSAEIGTVPFLSYPGTVVPATADGVLRMYHGSRINARDQGNGNNRNLVRWGVTANDTATFGDATVPTEVVGTSVSVGDQTFIGLEHAYLESARDVIAIGRSTALTATQMPSGTGSGVVYIANATTPPMVAALVCPSGGGILHADGNLGLNWRGANGVISTIAPHGDSGNTTLRRFVNWKSQPVLTTTSSGTAFTAASFNIGTHLGLTNGVLMVTARIVATSNVSGYSSVEDHTVIVNVAAGTPTVGSGGGTHDRSDSSGGNGPPYSVEAIDVSGTTVRLRLTMVGAVTSITTWAYFEVTGFET